MKGAFFRSYEETDIRTAYDEINFEPGRYNDNSGNS